MMKEIYKITEDGERISSKWFDDQYAKGIFPKKKIVGAQWENNGKLVTKCYKQASPPEFLPDKTGVIFIERDGERKGGELVFFEPDGRERFRVSPTVGLEGSEPNNASFYYVECNHKDRICYVYLNDGNSDYRARLNIETGKLTDFEKTRV